MTEYVRFDKLKKADREMITSKRQYPHRTKGHGVRMYLYPISKNGNLLDQRRRHI